MLNLIHQKYDFILEIRWNWTEKKMKVKNEQRRIKVQRRSLVQLHSDVKKNKSIPGQQSLRCNHHCVAPLLSFYSSVLWNSWSTNRLTNLTTSGTTSWHPVIQTCKHLLANEVNTRNKLPNMCLCCFLLMCEIVCLFDNNNTSLAVWAGLRSDVQPKMHFSNDQQTCLWQTLSPQRRIIPAV